MHQAIRRFRSGGVRYVVALALVALLAGCGRGTGSVDARASTEPGPAAAAMAETSATIAFWQARAAADPADYVALSRLGAAHLRRARQTGDVAAHERAHAALVAAHDVAPTPRYDTVTLLSLVAGARHRFAEALAFADEAVALEPAEPAAYGARGDALLALGRYDDARMAYRRMVADAPGLASFARLALIETLTGERERAEVNWRNAIDGAGAERAEDVAWAQTQFGRFLVAGGRLADADAAFAQALDAFPGYVHALAGRADIAAMRGHYAAAIAGYEAVLGRMPLPEYVSALGDVYAAAGRDADAARQWSLFDAIDRLYRANGIVTDLEVARFTADHGAPAVALDRARAAYDARPSIESADVLAWALYRNGRFAEARERSQEALRLGTEDPTMLFHAGMIRAALGEPDARAMLERAEAINPRFSLRYADTLAATLHTLDASARATTGGN